MLIDDSRRSVPRRLPVTHSDPSKAARHTATTHVVAEHKPKSNGKHLAKGHSQQAEHKKARPTETPEQKKRFESRFDGVNGKVDLASRSFEKSAAWKKFNGEVGNDRRGASGELNVLHAGVSGSGKAYADLAHGRIGAEGSVGAKATLVDARGEAHANYGWGSTKVDGEGYVGAGANAKGDVEFDPRKGSVDAGVDASAFAGARASASVTQNVGPVGAKAGVEGWAGVGAEAKGDVGLKNGKLEAKLSVGAALGLGGEVSFGVTVDPVGAAKDVAHVASGAAHTVTHGLESGAKSVAHFFGL